MSDEKDAPQLLVIGNFNLSAQLPNGRAISVVSHVFHGEDIGQLNERLDLYQEAIERQRARCEIPELEATREQQIRALDDYRKHLEALTDKRKKGDTLSSQERMALQNAKVNIERANSDIKKGDEKIAEARLKAGVGT